MESKIITDETIKKILNSGKIYRPAHTHYGDPTLKIECDSCGKSSLDACMGYQNYDFCLECVDKASREVPQKKIWGNFPIEENVLRETMMKAGINFNYNYDYNKRVTKMRVDDFTTKMVVSDYMCVIS